MIDPTKITPEKLAEMNDSLIMDNNHLRGRIAELEQQLAERTEQLRKEYLSAIDWAGKHQILYEQNLALLAALEQVKLNSISLADAQVVALEAIASVKTKGEG